MRRLTLLLFGFALAFYAHSFLAGGDAAAGEIGRRSVLFYAAATVLFAWAAGSMPPQRLSGQARTWPTIARSLAAVAVVLAVALAGLSFTQSSEGVWIATLWVFAAVLTGVAAWWPGEPEGYQPPAYRWTTDAAGRWVRAALGEESATQSSAQTGDGVPGRGVLLWPLALAGIAGAVLRLWQLAGLPSGCVAAECEAALRLVNSLPSSTSLYDLLAHGLYRLTADGLYSLRLAGALIGVATLPVFYWAARPLERAGGAALVTMLLAFLPWHIWASRTSEPWIAAPLLISLAAGAALRAYASVDRRRWWAAGLTAGLLVVDAGPALAPALVWAILVLAFGAWRLSTEPVARATPAVNLGVWAVGAVVVALPGLAQSAVMARPLSSGAGVDALAYVATGLLHSGAGLAYFLEHPLLPALIAALAVLGLGQLARSLHRPHAALILSGALVYFVYLIRSATPGVPLTGPALALVPFLLLAAVASLDTLTLVFWRTWRSLVPARYVLGGALAIVLIAGGWQLLRFLPALDNASSLASRTVDEAMGSHVATCLARNSYAACVQGANPVADEGPTEDGDYRPVIYVPASALEHPATRLLLGAESDTDRVRVFDIARDVPHAPVPDGPALYLLAAGDQAGVDLLRQFYPNAHITALPADAAPAQFVAVAVDRADLLERQGLEGLYFAGNEFDAGGDARLTRRDGPLAFDWRDEPPLPGAFSVLWEGSLQAPAAGSYRFSVDLPSTVSTDGSAFTLQLDDRLILDSSLGLLEKDEELAGGFYRLAMRYRTDGIAPPPDWSVRWQPPGQDESIVPRESLYSPALPDMGLIGTYHAGSDSQGPVLTTRKDLLLGAPADLPGPYNVSWQGKLAASRAGEYRFSVTSNGSVQLFIDGRAILSYLPPEPNAPDEETPVYAQASVYLPQGWRDIDLRYSPAADQPSLRLLWQPPGSAPSLLPPRYLRPDLGQLFPGDAALPPAPDLLDPSLGDDDFALSYVDGDVETQTVFPPADLPPLLLEEAWYVGGACGAADGQLSAPRGVAIDAGAGRVYVVDTGNRRVLAFDLQDGSLIETFTTPAFEEPVDLAIGAGGAITVLDAVGHPLTRIDTETGEAAPIALDAEFYRPRGLDIDSLGDLFIADTGGARVVMLDAEGRLLGQFGGVDTALGRGQPVDTLVHNGELWTVSAEDGRLWRVYDQAALAAIPRSSTIDGPHLASLPGRGFFLSDPADRTIRYHAASGEPLLQFAYADAFLAPVGIAAAEADGVVYLAVADSGACTVSLWRGLPARLQP